MKINNKEIKAIIFDLDGTLLDSTGMWKEIDKKFFAKRNMEVPPQYAEEIVHIGLKDSAILTKEKYGIKESVEEILKEWNDASMNMYLYEIPLKPFVVELLEKCKKENIKMAVATANSKELYEPCLKRLNIYHYFDFLGDVNMVNEGKSSVKLYNYVASKLNESPENIAVFEDISIGLKTAYENGYISVAVFDVNAKKDDERKRQYSYLYVNSFDELL